MTEHHVTDPTICRGTHGPFGCAVGYRVTCSCGWTATASLWSLAIEYGKDHRLATHLHERRAS
jgi:hypothetical protein